MDDVTQWVPWVPKVGDQKPPRYQFKAKVISFWTDGGERGSLIDDWDVETTDFRIPAPTTPLDIDLPYLLKKSAACSPEIQSQVLALKAKFAEEVGKLIEVDEARRKEVNEQVSDSRRFPPN